MKILKNSRKTTFIMSDGGGHCPSMTLVSGSVKIRDDYRGSLRTRARLLRKVI